MPYNFALKQWKLLLQAKNNVVFLVRNLLNPEILCFHAYFFGLQQMCLDVNTRTVKRDFEIEIYRLLETQKCVDSMRQRANCFDVR